MAEMTLVEKLQQLLGLIPEIVEMIFETVKTVAAWIWTEPLALVPCLIGLSLLGISVLRGFIKTKG